MNQLLLDPRTARQEGNRIAQQEGFTKQNEIDAFRHSVWQATLSQAFGDDLARRAGDLIELVRDIIGDNPPRDRNMDQWNNREGRDMGKEAQQQGLTDQ